MSSLIHRSLFAFKKALQSRQDASLHLSQGTLQDQSGRPRVASTSKTFR